MLLPALQLLYNGLPLLSPMENHYAAGPPMLPSAGPHPAAPSLLQLLYNDLSPMENHHVAAAFSILCKEPNNFLGHLSRLVGRGAGGGGERGGEDNVRGGG